MSNYPVVLTNLECGAVVIGGGEVAARKVEGLLTAGAGVTVISPQFAPVLEELAAQGRITALRRAYRVGDLAGARLVIAATDDPQVNRTVWEEAQGRGCLVNVVDDPTHCTFHVPAVARRGPVAIAVSTGGASPALAKHLRQKVEAAIGPEYAQLAALLAGLRPAGQALAPAGKREAFWRTMIERTLPLLRQGQADEAEQEAIAMLQRMESEEEDLRT